MADSPYGVGVRRSSCWVTRTCRLPRFGAAKPTEPTTGDDSRREEVYRIGVDEVSYRKGHRYLTVVADHDPAGLTGG